MNPIEERDKLALGVQSGYVTDSSGLKDLVRLNKRINKQLRKQK